ncbi:MAG TPA: tRNA (N6-threonylcarbamoyladenosine(37)-N6)-methyltransferase TrmO [Polyangiaceae bacterium]|nr:tRNA (N6-threonylcarbamoyladenosine(37)-N6)-methyltransferase TrmO [Polyangiaceae bacterium]
MVEPLTLRAIGVAHTPFLEKRDAPRQPTAGLGVRGQVVLFPGENFEHALEDLQGFSHIWLLFWFHQNELWRPKVLPPRSARKRGVFSTRSPHRPNPIGMSLVELERIDGLTLHVRNLDILNGSPILDVKPYVPYADSAHGARSGWLGAEGPSADPEPPHEVAFEELAERQLGFLVQEFEFDLGTEIRRVLELGPQPHPYRRIRRFQDGYRLAIKEWRADFKVQGRSVTVTRITSGYRPEQLANESPELSQHRAFVAAFGC